MPRIFNRQLCAVAHVADIPVTRMRPWCCAVAAIDESMLETAVPLGRAAGHLAPGARHLLVERQDAAGEAHGDFEVSQVCRRAYRRLLRSAKPSPPWRPLPEALALGLSG